MRSLHLRPVALAGTSGCGVAKLFYPPAKPENRLPGDFHDTRHFALEGELAEAHAAEAELAR